MRLSRPLSLKLRSKLSLAFIFIGVVSVLSVGWLSYESARTALREESFNKLTAIREIKSEQIRDYFQQIENQVLTFSEDLMIVKAMQDFRQSFHEIENELPPDHPSLLQADDNVRDYYRQHFLPRLTAGLAGGGGGGGDKGVADYWPAAPKTRILQAHYIAANPHPVGAKDKLDDAGDGSRYSEHHRLYHPLIRRYLKKFGYYDIFLIDADTGHILYSVYKEVDYGTSLLSGPYRHTNFAAVFNAARESGQPGFVKLVDFMPYAPSYYAAASFIASPIFAGERMIGIAVFQMPVDRINSIMTSNERWREIGQGESGESYLVGADMTMRSQSRFLVEQPEAYLTALRETDLSPAVIQQIRSTGSSIGLQRVTTEGSRSALAGVTGKGIFTDYRGVSVLSAYRPFEIEGLHWALISEIDAQEAFALSLALRWQIALGMLIMILLAVIMGLIFARYLTRPLTALGQRFQLIADGDLTQTVDSRANDELGQLCHGFNQLLARLRASIAQSQSSSTEVLGGTRDISEASQSLSQGAVQQADAIQQISASIADRTARARADAKFSEQAHQTVVLIESSAKAGKQRMDEMVGAMQNINENSRNISRIISTVDEIAFQTNLLALNAAVEAARVGVHGQGFAVVAAEVRHLASRCKQAAAETAALIRASVIGAESGMDVARQTAQSIHEIISAVGEISSLMEAIAQSVHSQNAELAKVQDGIAQIEQVTRLNADISKNNTAIARQLSESADKLNRMLSQFNTRANAGSNGADT